VSEPECWLSCALQLLNYILTHSRKVLANQCISKANLYSLYALAKERADYEYFLHTLEYYIVKVGIRYT
jgi:hypothetical protein